ncbi:N-acyl homoserine lactonase family protein [Diaminobutyricibacter sp. McL0618]|uniref:N-acyl homoserine lactonase family protein n=1 Tax=Leifsonia sp. McL0618 TaxID=3415677 RepID=UPI003CEFD4B1
MAAEALWQVAIVRHGTLLSTRAEMHRYPGDGREDEPRRVDYYFWIVSSATRTVVIDTGFSTAAASRRGRTATVDPARVLAWFGVTPDWDGEVVITHAHWDHTGQLAKLHRATFVLSEAELDYRRDESATDVGLTEPGDLEALWIAETNGRVRAIDHAVELHPGLTLIPAPGHTPGQLIVQVNTPDGVVVLVSDAVHFDEELRDRSPFAHMTDLRAAGQTYQLIEDIETVSSAVVVAGHEPDLLDRFSRINGPLHDHVSVIGAPQKGTCHE